MSTNENAQLLRIERLLRFQCELLYAQVQWPLSTPAPGMSPDEVQCQLAKTARDLIGQIATGERWGMGDRE